MDFGSRIVIKIYRAVGPEWMLMSDAGRYWSNGPDTAHDVFMAPIEKTVWINIYPECDAYVHPTQAAADEATGNTKRLGGKAHPITYTE